MDRQSARLRIVMCLNRLGDNGVTTHVDTLTRLLIDQGASVQVLYAKDEPGSTQNVEWFERTGASATCLDMPDFARGASISARSVWSGMHAVLALARRIVDFRADIVHNHAFGLSAYPGIASAITKTPFVTTCHSNPTSEHERKLKKWRPALRPFHPVLGRRIIAVSREIQGSLHSMLGITTERLTCIFNGIDCAHFRPPNPDERQSARRTLALSEDELVLCSIGRVVPDKRHDLLIRALAELRDQGGSATALVAGKPSGSFIDRCKDLAINLGVSNNVRFLGFGDSRTILWASDVFLLLSEVEGYSLVTMEAMACGVVPVRTPTAGVFDQIEDEVNGFIVPFGDHQKVVQTIRLLSENVNRRKLMAARAAEWAKVRFDYQRMYNETLQIYGNVLHESGRRRS